MAVRVPTDDRPSLQLLAQLADPVVEELWRALGAERARVLIGPLRINGEVASLAQKDLDRLLDVLWTLSISRMSQNAEIDEFASDVANSTDLEIAAELRDILQSRIAQLFRIEPLMVMAKAISVQTEHQYVYHAARIITEVRPIFEDDPTRPPLATVACHSLKIEYHDGAQMKEFFFGLDGRDLVDLLATLNRAIDKENSLRRTDMKLLDVDTKA